MSNDLPMPPPSEQDPSAPTSPEGVSGETVAIGSQLSKRAARRIIQRALVLTGRDRALRQRLRSERFTLTWEVANWMAWTVLVDRGRLDFERRPARRPSVTLGWSSDWAFWSDVEGSAWTRAEIKIGGVKLPRQTLENLYRAFCAALRGVLRNPVDEEGDPLV